MTIRRKVLVLFGVIALVPALITAILDSALLRSLSDEITKRNAEALADQTLTLMHRIADEYARSLDNESRRIQILLSLQREFAERILGERSEPARAQGRAFFSHEFDDEAPHLELELRSVGRRTMKVSWSHQVFHAAAGVEESTLTDAASALLGMQSLYQKIRRRDDEIVSSQYVVLNNGLSAAYPGHGDYPQDFDGRQRPWFEAQARKPEFRWYQPHADATTGALVINATEPLFDDSGSFIGITGIDIDLEATFEILSLPPHLKAGSELMQVIAVEPPAARESAILILARQHHDLTSAEWKTLPKLKRFILSDREDHRIMQAAMLAGDNGHLVTTMNGEEKILLFRRFGETLSYIVMLVPMARATDAAMAADDFARSTTRQHIRTLVTMLMIVGILVAAIAVLGARQLTQPIDQLKLAVQRLGDGDFSTRANVRTGDELETLGSAFDAMVPRLEAHAQVEESLALAREIQQQLLPASPPKLTGFEIHGVSLYSDETGGDYFDYVNLYAQHGHRIGVVVADVSGHGIGPALLMATTRALLHGGRGRGFSLGQLLEYVNHQLAQDVSRGHFVTLFLLALEAGEDSIEWSTAGHDPAFHFRANHNQFHELGGEGIPLGIDADWHYATSGPTRLDKGDIVVIGTDGIWEASDEQGERFGKSRLCDFIREHHRDGAATLCAGLKDAVSEFRGGRTQHDDVTIVVVKRI